MSEITLKSAVPIVFVRDVSASAAFFREKLGFELDFLYGTPPFYSSVSRGEAGLHLRCVRQPNFSELAAQEASSILAIVEVSDCKELFEEFKERGVEVRTNADQTTLGRDGFPCPRSRRERDFIRHLRVTAGKSSRTSFACAFQRSAYHPKLTRWHKVLNRAYSQRRGRTEGFASAASYREIDQRSRYATVSADYPSTASSALPHSLSAMGLEAD